jgi:hypothetical protein
VPRIDHKILIPALLLLLLSITFIVYWPGLAGDFIFDDFVNIINNPDVHLTSLSPEALSRVFSSGLASTLSRPLSMLTFGLNHYFAGLDPWYFKLINLLLHLLTGIGIFLLSRELLAIGPKPEGYRPEHRQLLALLVTACWMLHPLNVSSVLYIVQRMNLLSALVVVYTLYYYCRVRQRDTLTRLQASIALGAIVLLVAVGALFKENAVLTVLFILVIEVYLLKFNADVPGQDFFLKLFGIFLVAVPACLAVILLLTAPELLVGDYNERTFTMGERLLTETRALWMYMGWLVMPDTRDFVFHHDNFALSRSLLAPLSTLFASLGLVCLLAFIWLLRKKLPYLCFGLAFFLAGHALESTIVNLELVFEHRNYLPGFGLMFGGIHTLLHLPHNILSRKPALAFLGVFLVFLIHGTFLETRKWSSTNEHLLSIVDHNPDSHRINYSLGFTFMNMASLTPDNKAMFDAASYFYRRAVLLDDNEIRGHTGLIMADSQNGMPVDETIVADLVHRLRTLPLQDDTLSDISMLTECWYGNFCSFDKSVLVRVFNAISDNEVSAPVTVQAILDQVGTGIIRAYRNQEDGKALLYLARQQRPDLTVIDVKLVLAEMEAGNHAQARLLLTEAQQKGGNEKLLAELAEISIELDRRESAP